MATVVTEKVVCCKCASARAIALECIGIDDPCQNFNDESTYPGSWADFTGERSRRDNLHKVLTNLKLLQTQNTLLLL